MVKFKVGIWNFRIVMRNQKYIRKSILWMARIWGGLIFTFVMVFLIAHIFEKDPSGDGLSGITDIKEIITFICFPLLTIIGLALAYKWEGLGGLISSLALLTAMAINKIADPKFFFLILPPGILYLVYWYLNRKQKMIERRMKLH